MSVKPTTKLSAFVVLNMLCVHHTEILHSRQCSSSQGRNRGKLNIRECFSSATQYTSRTGALLLFHSAQCDAMITHCALLLYHRLGWHRSVKVLLGNCSRRGIPPTDQ